jgi:teichuronic acid exporter
VNDLKSKTIDGVLWGVLEKFGNQIIQFVIGLALARLLLPEDYGLIGMTMIFIAFSQAFIEGGFTTALIRKKDASNGDFSTVFWFNLFVSVFFYVAIYVSAPLISKFYNEPKLLLITRLIGLNLILNAVGIVQRTILIKRFDFKAQAKIHLTSILLSGLVGIAAAKNGYGVWALVASNILKNLLMVVFYWLNTSWKPSFEFSTSLFKSLFKFSSRLMISSILNNISENLYSLVIGKLFSSKSLGFFTRAQQFQQLPVSGVYGAINSVCLPLFSQVQDDHIKLREYYSKVIKLTSFVIFPVMGIIAVLSDDIIVTLLTEKWLPSSPLIKILCIIGAFYPIHAINLDILKVKGRSDLFLKLEVIKQALNFFMIWICYRYDVIGLAWGMVCLNILCLYLNTYFSKALINYSFFNQMRDMSLFGISTVIMLFLLQLLKSTISSPTISTMLIPLFGLVTYAFVSYILKIPEFNTVIEIAKSLKSKFARK